jgi:hypothetical protein
MQKRRRPPPPKKKERKKKKKNLTYKIGCTYFSSQVEKCEEHVEGLF